MKTTLGQIVDSVPALNNLMGVKFSVKTSYAISKNVRLLDPELKQFEEKRVELVKKYGKEEKEGSGEFKVLPENMQKWAQEIEELRSIDVEIALHPIPFLESDQVSPADLMFLDWMLAEKIS